MVLTMRRYDFEEELMNDNSFDTLTRHAAGRVSRRASLLALGTAGVAALAGPISGEAKKQKRKQKQSVGKKARQKCQQQVGQCVDFLTPICVGDVTCLAKVQRCCAVVGNCDPVGLFTCVATL